MPSLTLGVWNVHTVEAGYLWLDGGSMFGSVPKPLWSREHPPDERNRIRLATRCLLLDDGTHRILIDDGVGDTFCDKLRGIYRVEQDDVHLEGSLKALGFGFGDVTDVFLTHLHFDHAGGSTRRDGDALVPTLPNARYWVQRKNLENARHPNPRERASYMPENFEPLAVAGVLEVLEGTESPWSGVEIIPANGHTRGQQLLRVSGPEGALYYVADLIPTRSHVRIPFVMGYDVAAIETMDEKRRLLERAAGERAWVCLEHDPEMAFGRPMAEGDDFAWSERVAAGAERVPMQAG